jgi:hypothetical protein
VLLRDRGEVRNSPMHQKGIEEAWHRGSSEGATCGGTMATWRCFGEVGAAPLAQRATLKVRAAPGTAHGGERKVVRLGDGSQGEMETGDGDGFPLTGNNNRVADNRSREGAFYRRSCGPRWKRGAKVAHA